MKDLKLRSSLQTKTVNPVEIERMVGQIEGRGVVAPKRPSEPVQDEPTEVRMKKTSFDLPLGLYKAIHRRLLDEDRSFKDYVLGLIQKDMKTDL